MCMYIGVLYASDETATLTHTAYAMCGTDHNALHKLFWQ